MLNVSPEDSANSKYYKENLPTYHPLFDLVSSPFMKIIGGDPYTPADARPCEGTARAKLEARWGKFKLEQFRQGCIKSSAEPFCGRPGRARNSAAARPPIRGYNP